MAHVNGAPTPIEELKALSTPALLAIADKCPMTPHVINEVRVGTTTVWLDMLSRGVIAAELGERARLN